MATTAAPPPAYPDYDSIPSSSAPQPRPSRIPSPILHLFSLFPLVTFPAPPSHESPPPTFPPSTPELHVLPGHSRTDSQGNPRTTWTSRDVRCLTSQVEFLFRKVDFETRQIEREEAWGPKVGGLPFVHLPQPQPRSNRSGGPSAAASTAAPPRLLAADSIPTWVETLAPFPYERVEAGGDAFEPYPSQTAKAEAEMWTTLLQKGVMAAVLLAQLSCEAPSSSSKPFFSSQVHSHLANQHLAREGNLINSLSSSASASTSLSRWSSFVPGMSFSWIGVGVSGIGGSNDDGDAGLDGETKVTSATWPEELDVDAVIAEGTDGIRAVGKKMARQSDGKEWFLGASQPTSLDALLFSQLHTILSLSAGGSDSSVARLKEAIKEEEVLVQWTKRVYDDFVKEKEVQWRSRGSEAGEKPLP